MKATSSNSMLVLLAVVLLGAGYWYVSSDSTVDPSLTAGVALNDSQIRFQTLLSELRSVSFDTSIFADANFNSLVDLSTPVTPEATGRIDPFAPIAGVGK